MIFLWSKVDYKRVILMEHRKITISKKGDDGYKVISVRIKEKTLEAIEDISTQTNRSRNEIINILLESATRDIEIAEG